MKPLTERKWVVRYLDKWGDPASAEYTTKRDACEFYQRLAAYPARCPALYQADTTLTSVAVQKDVE